MTEPDWRRPSRPSTRTKVAVLIGFFVFSLVIGFVFMVLIPGR